MSGHRKVTCPVCGVNQCLSTSRMCISCANLERGRFVLTRPDHPITVIHDADVPEYAAAIKELAIYHTIVATDPATAVVWS